jgi:uncharacterized membrane protein YebE (DUF533 family)
MEGPIMFDTKKLLNDLLSDAKGLAAKGGDIAAGKLGTSPGNDKDNLVKGLGAGAVGGVLMGLLLGTKGGRKIGGGALKLGSLAAIGTVAYKAYQQYQASKGGTAPAASGTLAPPAEPKADPILLLRAMIAAANADGHIDADERARITVDIGRLGLGTEAAAALEAELKTPLSAEQLAHGINDPAVGAEVYTLSAAIIDKVSPEEAAYLQRLTAALKLDGALVAQINTELNA